MPPGPQERLQNPDVMHLAPLVNALIAAGNRLTDPSDQDRLFRPSQGGPYCWLAEPIDFAVIRDLPRRPEVQLAEDEGLVWCRHCWASIEGGHA